MLILGALERYYLYLVNPNLLCEFASIQHDLTMIFRAQLLRGQRWVFQADPMAKQPEIGGEATRLFGKTIAFTQPRQGKQEGPVCRSRNVVVCLLYSTLRRLKPKPAVFVSAIL